MIAGASRLGGASDDWKTSLDGIGGAIEYGIVVRGRQGGSGITGVGIVVAEAGVGVFIRSWTPQASETQTPIDFWHTAIA